MVVLVLVVEVVLVLLVEVVLVLVSDRGNRGQKEIWILARNNTRNSAARERRDRTIRTNFVSVRRYSWSWLRSRALYRAGGGETYPAYRVIGPPGFHIWNE